MENGRQDIGYLEVMTGRGFWGSDQGGGFVGVVTELHAYDSCIVLQVSYTFMKC